MKTLRIVLRDVLYANNNRTMDCKEIHLYGCNNGKIVYEVHSYKELKTVDESVSFWNSLDNIEYEEVMYRIVFVDDTMVSNFFDEVSEEELNKLNKSNNNINKESNMKTTKKLFINFSNHNSSKWSEEQKQAALSMADEIIDVQFPNIEPSATDEQVYDMACKYMDEILDLETNDCMISTIHIMGEMTFVYSFLTRLCEYNDVVSTGITAVASTTERISVENPDGSKTVQFKFNQFRRY